MDIMNSTLIAMLVIAGAMYFWNYGVESLPTSDHQVAVYVYAGSRSFVFEISPLETIPKFKELIQQRIGIKVPDQKLWANSRRVEVGTLHSNRISDGTFVFLEGVLDLKLNVHDETVQTLFVLKDWPVSKLKELVQSRINISLGNKHFECEGRPLLKGTFKDNGVLMDSDVFLKDNNA